MNRFYLDAIFDPLEHRIQRSNNNGENKKNLLASVILALLYNLVGLFCAHIDIVCAYKY